MAIIKFENGIRVRFNGNPNQTDIEEMALNLGIGNNNQKQFQDVKSTSDAFFPSNKNDNPLIAGAKAIGNLPKSIYEFGKGIVSAVSHPIQTVKTVGNILGQGGEKVLENTVGKGIEAITGQEIQKQDTPEFDAFAKIMKDRYGSLENLQKTATEDPFGFGADLLGLIEGGAGLVGKTAELNKVVGTVGRTATRPIASAVEKTGNVIKGTTKFGLSQATGLNPESISNILKDPGAYKNLNPEIRVETAKQVADALDERLGELSDLGKEYQGIRVGTDGTPGLVTVPEDTISKVLNKYGVKLDKNNKIITSPESRPLSAGDKAALQEFIDNYGNVINHTNNSFLNTREALSNLAKYDSTKTNLSTQISRDLRGEYDKLGKTQIKGLKELDTQYAPERELLGQLKKDIFNASGELKEGAISKIANLTGKGKEQVLERVKQIIPDIEQRVNVIKTMEDIEKASGLKVGTYVRAGGLVSGIATGNIPIIIASILAQPEIAVPLLKGAGYIGEKASPIINAIKNIADDVNNFRLPASFLNNNESQIKLGMSIEDVSKTKLTPKEFLDAQRLKAMGNEKFKNLPETYKEYEKLWNEINNKK